jgi:uncharacterized membrane protein YjgN (DUF898 family)
MPPSAVASVPGVPLAPAAAPVPAGPGWTRLAAGGEGLPRIVWRGLFLTIVTLGIYRFWYRTDLRRWYWSRTVVDGDGFEYRGTPGELIIGFLIALAVTLPLYFAGALAALFIASEATTNLITLLGLAILAALAQYGAFRARRFRLTRTAWRGLRFDQSGSPWRYARVSMLWGLATLLTLGLTLPLFRRSIEAMKIANTRFGNAEGRFSASAGGLMLRWLPIWLVVAAALGYAALDALEAVAAPEDSIEQGFAILGALGGLVAAVAAFCLTWPIYRAAEFRLFTAGSGLGPLAFRSDLKAASLFGMYIKFGLVLIGLGVLALFLASLTIGVAVSVLRGGGGGSGAGAIAAAALLYLAGVYVFMALKELMLNRAFWLRSTGSIEVSGLDRIGEILGAPVAGDAATGEGLGDAIDFGGV